MAIFEQVLYVATLISLHLLRQGRKEAGNERPEHVYTDMNGHSSCHNLNQISEDTLVFDHLVPQLYLVSNNPTQATSHPDMFSLHLFVMLDISRPFIGKNKPFEMDDGCSSFPVLRKSSNIYFTSSSCY